MPLLADAPRFLTLEELQRELTRYKYRDGWDMTIFQDPWEGAVWYLRADVVDGYDPSKTIEVRIRSNIPPIPDAAYFAVWLQWRLNQVELHEAREYLQVRETGRPVYDPHDPVEPGGKASRNDDPA
jgi:hypothetical protein